MVRNLFKSLIPAIYTVLVLADFAFAANAAAKPTTGEFITQTLWFVAFGIAAMYILVWQPTKIKADQQRKFVSSLAKGTDVLVAGSIIAKVFSVSDNEIVVETSPGQKLRVKPEAVSAI